MARVQNLRTLTKSDLGSILIRWQFLRHIWSLLTHRVIKVNKLESPSNPLHSQVSLFELSTSLRVVF